MRIILDSGAIIASERNDATLAAILKAARKNRTPILVPATVVAETWRGASAHARAAHLFGAVDGFPELNEQTARQVGALLTISRAAQIVDGNVVAIAIALRPATIVTSDVNDITHLLNLISDQFTGLHGITVPGTLRDSLLLLALVLEQQTELQPTRIMTDTGAYSDVVFGLFRLLGYRFSPRLADIGGARLWRIDPDADYGPFNDMSRHRVNLSRITENWDDCLRLVGSLKLGRVRATGIMRTLQVGEHATRLAQAIAEIGRIEKSIHVLRYLDDESLRRETLVQLNRGEGRHGLSRVVFHGQRGELRQRYRDGQEDQLGALGLVVNMIVLWNTLYMQSAIDQLRAEGYPVLDEDIARLNPHVHDHINMLGRYSFSIPESVAHGELRPLRNPSDPGP